MMLLGILAQEAPADTFGYMVLGLGVILGTMALYIGTLVNRRSNLKRDLQVLDEVEHRAPATESHSSGQ